MRVLIATPLYPPDTAESAHYVKELAKRLSENHNVTIITYGRLPEKIKGVRIVAINKLALLFLRLLRYTKTLLKESRNTDIIYAENGASVEFPLGLVAVLTRHPVIFHLGDRSAHSRASDSITLSFIEGFVMKRAKKIIAEIPMRRPIILPFNDFPKEKFDKYNASWSTHINTLENIFKNVR